jgi:hypothetical protein
MERVGASSRGSSRGTIFSFHHPLHSVSSTSSPGILVFHLRTSSATSWVLIETSQHSVSWSEPVVRLSSAITASETLSAIAHEAMTRCIVVGSWLESGRRVRVTWFDLQRI